MYFALAYVHSIGAQITSSSDWTRIARELLACLETLLNTMIHNE